MKVGIDTFGLDHGQSGLGSYLYYLMQNLEEDKDIEFELFGQETDRYTYKAKFDVEYTAVNVSDNVRKQRAWHFFKADRFAAQREYDVVIYSAANRMIPSSFSVRSIAIVNDIVSKQYNDRKDKYFRNVVIPSFKKINAIIVPSEFVKNDLTSLDITPEKIFVIPNGIDHSIFYQQHLTDVEYVNIKPYAIKRPYIIYPTKISGPDKNYEQLINAFNIFKEKTKLEHRLVLAGSQTDYAEEVMKFVLSSPYASDIFMTGFFPHKELGTLYANADACIFPSSQEGVGLPILETMASGIPVACADKGALSEISGGNAVLFNPDDVDGMAAAIEKVVCDNDVRGSLVERGLKWAGEFTWKKTAERIVEVIKK
ncbi:MAG: glycosyltransferase family 4 protein [Treponema sp.]|nr:glycosyltransferase family 4 protein [Candidatus Treponema scatequi]